MDVDQPLPRDHPFEIIKRKLYIRSPKSVAEEAVSASKTVTKQMIPVEALPVEKQFYQVELQKIMKENGGATCGFDDVFDTLRQMTVHPEAAKVVASAWDGVRDDPPPVVAVGKATEKALEGFGIDVTFVPSKATAETLAAELELKGEGTTTLLYPASAKAKKTLQSGLEARGFGVTRLNTYDTVTANWSNKQKEDARNVKIACFASPSSIKGWLQNTDNNNSVVAACIGETSYKACKGHNWDESKIFYPEKPGIDGWVQAIQEALNDTKVTHT